MPLIAEASNSAARPTRSPPERATTNSLLASEPRRVNPERVGKAVPSRVGDGIPTFAGMIRGVPLLLVCACVARAVPQGGNSAAPDSGAGAVRTGGPTSDAGSGASGADAGSISGGYDAGTAQAIDAGAWNPDATATLLDSDVISIAGVSADEQRLLVSRTYPPSDMELVTVGTPAVTLTSGTPYTSARFSPDGRSILLLQPSAIQDDPTLTLIRGDGTAARQLTSASRWAGFAGRWLYYDDESGADEVLYRLLPPDGDPQVIASFPPPHAFPGASLDYSTSPDGESVLYCHSPSGGVENCFLTSPVSASLPVPGWVRLWAPDGRWVISGGCTLIDATGASRQV